MSFRSLSFTRLAVFGSVLLLSACASVVGPRTVSISQNELQQKLAAKFPQQKRVLELYNVTLAAPTITLQPQSNRIATELHMVVHDRLLNRDYQGTFGASFGLRFDAGAGALTLANVTVNKVEVNGVSPLATNALGNVGRMLVEDQLEGYAIYRFKPEDLRSADRWGYSVGDIDVMPQGLQVHLQPKS